MMITLIAPNHGNLISAKLVFCRVPRVMSCDMCLFKLICMIIITFVATAALPANTRCCCSAGCYVGSYLTFPRLLTGVCGGGDFLCLAIGAREDKRISALVSLFSNICYQVRRSRHLVRRSPRFLFLPSFFFQFLFRPLAFFL
jgi:hypothetical protein